MWIAAPSGWNQNCSVVHRTFIANTFAHLLYLRWKGPGLLGGRSSFSPWCCQVGSSEQQ